MHGKLARGTNDQGHAVVDANCNPITLKLSEGQAHDGLSADDLLDTVQAGHILLADRCYGSDTLRMMTTERGAWANTKPMWNQVYVPASRRWLYRYRNLVEHSFSKLKHFRAISTRFEKPDADYLGLVKRAAAKIWVRLLGSVT
jgi:transposase